MRKTLPYPVLILVAGAIYFIAGRLGLELASIHRSATPVWPPAGIALAAFLLFGYRMWPAVAVAAFFVNYLTEGSAATSAGIAAGNTLEGLLGAYLVNTYANGWNIFGRAPHVFKFVLYAGVFSTMVSPMIGVTSLCLGGHAQWKDYAAIWWTWWLGDMTGNLIVAPFFLAWALDRPLPWGKRHIAETLFFLHSFFLISLMIFLPVILPAFRSYPQLAFIPLLIWSAFRFGVRISATAILILAGVAVWGTLRGSGPFVGRSPNESFLLLQSFMALMSVTTLVLGALIRERDETGESLRTAYHQLRKSDQIKSTFMQFAAHDLRTPLTAIKGYITLILSGRAGEVSKIQDEFLNRINNATDRLDRLLYQVLNISRLESGKAEMNIQQTDMNNLLREEVDLFKAEATVKKIALEMSIENNLETIPCDADKIREAVSNLVSNALKYTSELGRVQIHARRGTEAIQIRVTDNGIGIAPEDQGKIFEPFHHLHTSGLRGEQSTGLGLVLVKRIVEAHGGSIKLASQEGKGSQFTISLPVNNRFQTS